MNEHYVQTISLSFSVVEDRLELRCKSGNQSFQLWLTQRMWLQLTPNMIKWLVDSGVGALHTKQFIQDSFANNKEAPVELAESNDLGKPSTNQKDDSSASAGPSGEIITKWVREPWLCTTVNLQMSNQVIRIRFESDRSQHVFIFSMSAVEACHFLLAQKNALENSGWCFEWPSWLSNNIKLEQEAAGFLH